MTRSENATGARGPAASRAAPRATIAALRAAAPRRPTFAHGLATLALALALPAGGAAAQDAAAENPVVDLGTPATAEERVAFPSSEGIVEALLAEPVGEEEVPAVMIVHDKDGLDVQQRRMVQDLADAGFLALAVDLGSTTTMAADADFARPDTIEALSVDAAVENARATAQWLETHLRSNGSVGAVAFGWGAAVVARVAADDTPLDALVSYYGDTLPPDAISGIVDVPMLFHFAGNGEMRAEDVDAFARLLEDEGQDFAIEVWDGADTGFDDPSAAAHDAETAGAALERTIEFLEARLD